MCKYIINSINQNNKFIIKFFLYCKKKNIKQIINK